MNDLSTRIQRDEPELAAAGPVLQATLGTIYEALTGKRTPESLQSTLLKIANDTNAFAAGFKALLHSLSREGLYFASMRAAHDTYDSIAAAREGSPTLSAWRALHPDTHSWRHRREVEEVAVEPGDRHATTGEYLATMTSKSNFVAFARSIHLGYEDSNLGISIVWILMKLSKDIQIPIDIIMQVLDEMTPFETRKFMRTLVDGLIEVQRFDDALACIHRYCTFESSESADERERTELPDKIRKLRIAVLRAAAQHSPGEIVRLAQNHGIGELMETVNDELTNAQTEEPEDETGLY
jgi:hypothetical protein